MPTLYDVAKLAGVSPKTVSRVLNKEPSVSEPTKQRVLDAIQALDYHPNAIATSLKKLRSNIIGYIVPYGSRFVFQDPNMMEQLRGAHDVLTQEGYEILVSAPIYRKDALRETERLVKNRNVDGVIIYPTAGVERIISEFKLKTFFYVTLGRCFPEQRTNFVDLDLTPGAYLATKHLIDQGHRRIALINKPQSFFIFNLDDIFEGYRSALEEANIPVQSSLVMEGDFSFESGYRTFRQLWEKNIDLTAVICASDPMAYGALKAVTDMNLKPGRDVEVIAGDNLPLIQKIYPDISSIHSLGYEQGRQAGKMIIANIKSGQELEGVRLKAQFVPRFQTAEPVY
ncbi:MAG TPA: LacI family DNA-binding transcriptional regulator [Bacillota bacterium]|nr:LacI family DNA-binding transcriptional regulator [Bacillota bacterium]